MARCGCSGGSCSCVIKGTGVTQVTGAGTIAQPYVIDSRLYLTGSSEGTVNLTITGSGSASDPYVLRGNQAVYLNDLQDVVATGGSTGHVLAKQSDGTFALVPPSTAAVGAVATNNTLNGDGSSAQPLGVRLASGGGISSTPTGLAVAGFGTWSNYTPQITTASGHTLSLDGGSSITGRYLVLGKLVFLKILMNASLNIPVANGSYMFSLPVPDNHGINDSPLLNAQLRFGANYRDNANGLAVIEGSNRISRVRINRNDGRTDQIGGTYPQWGSYSFRLTIWGSYEAE